jgi:hypothetical protein
MLNLEEAQKELSEKNLQQIQTETAWKWGSRAAASYQNCLAAESLKKLALWSIAEEYYHEALEHAALVEGEDVLSQLKKELNPYQEKAAQDMDQYFGQVQPKGTP